MRVVPPVGGSASRSGVSALGQRRRAARASQVVRGQLHHKIALCWYAPVHIGASTQGEGVRLKSCPRTTRLIASDEAARPTGSSGRDPAFRQPKTPGGARFTSSPRTTANRWARLELALHHSSSRLPLTGGSRDGRWHRQRPPHGTSGAGQLPTAHSSIASRGQPPPV